MERRNQMTAALAAVLMVIDHIGAIFFPSQIIFRLIGRLSFPLFAYGIAQGVTYTSNFWRYMFRILLAAVISQPIYRMAFHHTDLNPLFTLCFGAVALWLWRKGEKERLLAGAFLIFSIWSKSSYSWYGVATIFLYGFYDCAIGISFYGQAILQVAYGYFTGIWVQGFSLFAFPLVGKVWKRMVYLPKYFFYVFYPLHLLILVAIRGVLY
ncbi:MAG: TraX family protein [Anaerotignum sp.]|nr:TraX family protein [Anaerotignum sp.]